MAEEVRFPLSPDSMKDRPFLTELYIRRHEDGYEIGLSNRRWEDYAWGIVSREKLEAALSLLNIEDSFDA